MTARMSEQSASAMRSDPLAMESRFQTPADLIERFRFELQDLPMEHHEEIKQLDIRVGWKFKSGIDAESYPDFLRVKEYIETFLRQYPNEVDYWELVNKRLCTELLEKFPQFQEITLDIEVEPTDRIGFRRGSNVTATRSLL